MATKNEMMDEHDVTNSHYGQPTLIIFASQHGIEGTSLWESSSPVPLQDVCLIRRPAKIEFTGSCVREGRLCKMFWVVCVKYWVLVPLFQNQTGLLIDSYHGSHMFKSLNILQPWATVCTTAHIISAWELRAVKTMLVIPGMWLLVGCSCRNLPSENVVPQKVLVWGKKIKSIPQQMNFAPSAPSLASQSALLSLGFGLRLWSKTRPFIAMTAWRAVPMILGMVRFVLKCRHVLNRFKNMVFSLRGTGVPRLRKEYAKLFTSILESSSCSAPSLCSVLTFECISQWMSEG